MNGRPVDPVKVLLLVSALSIPTLAQQAGPAAVAPAPRAVCEAPSWDFGRASNTNTVEHVFELANEGGAELQIQKVYAGCGCTAAQTGADHVGPGGKTQVSVRLNLAGRTGSQRKSVYVHTNDPLQPVLRLELSGEALGTAGGGGALDAMAVGVWDGKARVRPERVDFGRVKADAISEAEITLRGTSLSDIVKVEEIETGTTNLVAKEEPGKAGECRVVLRLLPGFDIGPDTATVVIRTSHPVLKTVAVPVTWKAEGDLYAMPEEITVVGVLAPPNAAAPSELVPERLRDSAPQLQATCDKVGVTRFAAVRSRSGKAVHLADIVCADANVKIEASPMPDGKGALLRVSGIVGTVNGSNRSITVRSADGVRLRVPIRVVASEVVN